jgi:uncharacterized hydrophobic protein (TIGR00271 family)
LNGSCLATNVAATLIAGFGLLENSPAVIIGAILIAMLFGPIVGIAMSLAEADLHLLGLSLVSELASVACVLAVGVVIGISTRDLTIGSEIISRTSPTLLDLLIGLVGGLAGGFTFVSTDLGGVVIGLAISTALVPPLTTCGILLARQLPTAAAGGFLLFLANFAAPITFGAFVTFWLAGHRPPAAYGAAKAFLPRLVFSALLLVLAFHLNGTLRRASARVILQRNIQKALATEVASIPGARLAQVTLVPQQGGTNVWAIVRTPQPVSPEQIGRLNNLVNRVAGRPVALTVRSVITAETRDGDVYEPQFFP